VHKGSSNDQTRASLVTPLLRTGHAQCTTRSRDVDIEGGAMRVHTIEMANLCVQWDVLADSDGSFQWIVLVTERGPEHRLLLERRGSCGHVVKGDARDIAADRASEIAVEFASLPGGIKFERAAAVPAAG
jgi:hypothetical protein